MQQACASPFLRRHWLASFVPKIMQTLNIQPHRAALGLALAALLSLALAGCKNDNPAAAADAPPAADPAAPAPPAGPPSPYAAHYQQCCYDLKWTDLARVDYREVLGQDEFSGILYPIFSDSLLWLDSCLVGLNGYAIPLEETGIDTLLVLSAFPYTQCFFCGNAGPESVVEVWLKDPERRRRVSMDKKVSISGRLYLNDTDPEHMQYQIREAELTETR